MVRRLSCSSVIAHVILTNSEDATTDMLGQTLITSKQNPVRSDYQSTPVSQLWTSLATLRQMRPLSGSRPGYRIALGIIQNAGQRAAILSLAVF